MNILEISQETLYRLIEKVENDFKQEEFFPEDINEEIHYKMCYFSGKNLFIDIKKDNENDCISFDLDNEDVGFLSGGLRKMISNYNKEKIKEIYNNYINQ